jgi:hypothetical protein
MLPSMEIGGVLEPDTINLPKPEGHCLSGKVHQVARLGVFIGTLMSSDETHTYKITQL